MPTMSSSLVKPWVTPVTALATRLRARPWSAASSSRSRIATSVESFCSKRIAAGTSARSLPLGPSTATTPGSILTLTPLGRGIGLLPTLDMMRSLPDLAKDFAAHPVAVSVASRHHPARRFEDVDAHPAEHARNFLAAYVHAASRPGHPLDFRNHRRALVAVLQVDLDGP